MQFCFGQMWATMMQNCVQTYQKTLYVCDTVLKSLINTKRGDPINTLENYYITYVLYLILKKKI